jgi:hypothetical protein
MRTFLGLVCSAGFVVGSPVFSNLNVGDTYNGAVGISVGAGTATNTTGYAVATHFSPSSTGSLTTLEAGITNCGTGSLCPGASSLNHVILSLYGPGPIGGGALLETFSLVGLMAPWVGQTNALVTATSVLHPTLEVGQTYWVVATAPDMLGQLLVWGHSTNSQVGGTWVRLDGAPAWSFQSGFETALRVSADAIPEPSSIGLLLAGLGGMLLAARRRASRNRSRG